MASTNGNLWGLTLMGFLQRQFFQIVRWREREWHESWYECNIWWFIHTHTHTHTHIWWVMYKLLASCIWYDIFYQWVLAQLALSSPVSARYRVRLWFQDSLVVCNLTIKEITCYLLLQNWKLCSASCLFSYLYFSFLVDSGYV